MSLLRNAQKQLASRGGRLTSQRRMILEALDAFDGHPTAEELYDAIKTQAPQLNLSTVYRNLHWLEQEGLIRSHRFDEDRGQQRFDPVLPTEHFHFICTSCKQVTEFNSALSDEIKRQFASQSGAVVDMATIALYGVCKDCRDTFSQGE